MILTLPWKELREHQPIWLTMVVATPALAVGLAAIVAPGDPSLAVAIAALTIFGMAATYGVVCGAMMFAGEHENGTLVFLDIFLGRRGRLWLGKVTIGAVLVATEALVVALALFLLKQQPPTWATAAVALGEPGRPAHLVAPTDLAIWFVVLPAVTLEAYAWGLLGSALTRRVLAGAAVAASMSSPVWMTIICLPPTVFFMLRLLAAACALLASGVIFMQQSRETNLGPAPTPEEGPDPRRRFLALADEPDRADEDAEYQPAPVLLEPAVIDLQAAHAGPRPHGGWDPEPVAPPVSHVPRRHAVRQASSPRAALGWLTVRQAWALLAILTGACLLLGLLIPANGEVLWPMATLLLGVACGTAAFAPEQRDLSYQFLASQHFPLPAIWRFKIVFWLTAAVVLVLALVLSASLRVAAGGVARREPIGFHFGTLLAVLGPGLFFSIWLAYGFCTAQVFVWLCRKSILAVLLSALVGAGALGLWMPSLLCQGMGGWQLWAPPLGLLAAGQLLVRAWAGGRIKERRPLYALIGVGLACVAWAGLSFTYRAVEVPDVGAPLDRDAFRAAIPSGADNAGGRKIQEALGELERGPGNETAMLAAMAEAARLPPGIIETPAGNGQAPVLLHLPACERLTDRLRKHARASTAEAGLAHLGQILALSRTLRNKAPLESYRAGTRAEASALDGLDDWLNRIKPNAPLLRRALDELTRHEAETPPPLDCLKTECFRAGGLADNPAAWTFVVVGPRGAGAVPDRWLVGGIVLSLETPWEAERKTRLWQAVWAGLFRAVSAPPGPLPEAPVDGDTSATTREILRGWLPAETGAAPTRAQLARLLDASWLAQDRLFCRVAPLRHAAARSRWRVDALRQVVALKLYAAQEGKTAQKLDDLVPKYLPALPADPYRDAAFGYRISPGEQIDGLGPVRPGQGVLWSVGPDRNDGGAVAHGGALPDDDPRWSHGSLDLVMRVP